MEWLVLQTASLRSFAPYPRHPKHCTIAAWLEGDKKVEGRVFWGTGVDTGPKARNRK